MSSWRTALSAGGLAPRAGALLRIHVGEYLLGLDMSPEQALLQFLRAQQLCPRAGVPEHDLAAYDGAVALYLEGAYADSAAALAALLKTWHTEAAYDSRACALWARRAASCAEYHGEHLRAGIPEPLQLDPLCGAAALAAYLRADGRHYDKKTVLSVCHVTGRGSTMIDVVLAARRLGIATWPVTADDAGLRLLFAHNCHKPMLAFVEHDHFIALTGGGADGVTYLCSDCGPWPGGQVSLTWKQWHMMNGGPYAVFCPHRGALDLNLAGLRPGAAAVGAATTRGRDQSGRSRPGGLRAGRLPALLAPRTLAGLDLRLGGGVASFGGHVKLYLAYEQGVTCGGKPESQHGACLIASLTDTGTSGADPQSAGGDNTSGAFKCGASFGDPAATPGGTFSYFDDAVSRQASILNPYNENFSWTYLANGWISQQNNGPAATSYTLNARGLLTDLRTTPIGQPNVTLSEFSNITWNDVLQRTGMTVSLPAAPAFGGQTTETYAGQNELQQEQSTRNGGYTEAFGYDGAENATTFKGALQSFNADNQNSADVWDGNGSPTTYSGIACSYDPESRLTASGATLTAGYTGAGLRAWKQTTAGRTYFLYDLDDQPICEVNSAGAVTAVTTFSDNGLLARHTSSGSVFYTFDPSGSVCQRLDSNANVLTTCLFDAYGTRSCTDADTDPYAGFGGQWGYYTDGETGLALLGHRYYDPSEGRFLTRDPASFDGGINLYSYCTDDPIDGSDPDGYFNARQVSQIERQATKCGWSTRKGNDGVLCQKPGHGMVTIPNVHGGSGSTGCKTFAAEQRELQACCQPEDPKPQPVPVPQPEPGKQKNRGRIVRKCLVVGGETGAVVCGCYVVYRCIRMIPSIAFPPLWPTIPANALCP